MNLTGVWSYVNSYKLSLRKLSSCTTICWKYT